MVLSSRDYYTEAVARKKRTAVTPDTEDESVLVPESPPGLAGESQDGTSITLAIRSPQPPRVSTSFTSCALWDATVTSRADRKVQVPKPRQSHARCDCLQL